MRAPDLDLDLVRCFVTVAESGGFTQASKQLHLTQSAITLKIKRLEDLLQRRLFRRTTKPLRLSPEGEVVLSYASQLLNLNRELLQRLARPTEIGALRLGIVQHFGYHFLPVWLAEFKREWPNVRLVADMGMTTDLLKGLEEERFDLVIASAGYTTIAQHKMASLLHERHLQKETLIWVQAERSKIDPKKDPLP
jgi:DNA-binding transcriptional LysR family regulator